MQASHGYRSPENGAIVAAETRMKKGPLPLVVGVTGHRDLVPDDAPRIVERTHALFAELAEKYQHTPLVLMSSLAEGADRLVARTALECGVDLYAVLPMSAQAYECDFESEESRVEFRELMRRSFNSTVIGAPLGTDAGPAQHSGPYRDRQYALSGAFLVSHSQIIIALWDGDREELLGGTSQIVRFALRGVPAEYLSAPTELLRANETGAVYHIRVGRRGKPKNAGTPADGWIYPGDEQMESGRARTSFGRSLRALERFNRDAVDSIRPAASSATGPLLSDDERMRFQLDPAMTYVWDVFVRADSLAMWCRNRTHAAMLAVFGTIAAAATLFAVFTNFRAYVPGQIYLIFLGLVLLAIAVDLAVTRSGLQDRFQDYRALAEGLRVEFYWRLGRVRESVYDHYLARQEGELNWIRNAMRAAHLHEPAGAVEPADGHGRETLLELVLARWTNEQERYFKAAAVDEQRRARRIRRVSKACLVVAGVAAIALATIKALEYQFKDSFPWLVTAVTLSLAGAALLTGYAQMRAYEEHARRDERMRELFHIAGERLEILLREGNLSGATTVLFQLGREALAETCDWLLLHRERQIEVPTG